MNKSMIMKMSTGELKAFIMEVRFRAVAGICSESLAKLGIFALQRYEKLMKDKKGGKNE